MSIHTYTQREREYINEKPDGWDNYSKVMGVPSIIPILATFL